MRTWRREKVNQETVHIDQCSTQGDPAADQPGGCSGGRSREPGAPQIAAAVDTAYLALKREGICSISGPEPREGWES